MYFPVFESESIAFLHLLIRFRTERLFEAVLEANARLVRHPNIGQNDGRLTTPEPSFLQTVLDLDMPVPNHGSLLELAVHLQPNDMIRALLAHGADVNINGSHALHIAIQFVSEKLVELLLEHGADPNLRSSSDGETALSFVLYSQLYYAPWSGSDFDVVRACRNINSGKMNILRLLLQQGLI